MAIRLDHVPVWRHRANTVPVEVFAGDDTPMDLSGRTLTAEVRTRQDTTAPLVTTWAVSMVDAAAGRFDLVADAGTFSDAPSTVWTDVRDDANEVVLPPTVLRVVDSVTEAAP